jgi:hypothetical protein
MISIADNAALARIDGFPAIGSIVGYELGSLSIQRNPALSVVLGGTSPSASVIEATQNQSLQQLDFRNDCDALIERVPDPPHD